MKEPYGELKKERLLCCYNQDWMKSGGQTLWNAIATCEMSKTCWPMGKLPMKDGFLSPSPSRPCPDLS